MAIAIINLYKIGTSQSLQAPTKITLDQKLKGKVGRVNFQPTDLSGRVEEVFTELVNNKNSSLSNQ